MIDDEPSEPATPPRSGMSRGAKVMLLLVVGFVVVVGLAFAVLADSVWYIKM